MGAKEDKENDKVARETLGKYFYDLSKAAFSVGLVGQVLPYFVKSETTGFTWFLLLFGLTATISFAYLGNKIIKGKLWKH